MPLYRRKRSAFWWYDLTVQGTRLRGSTGATARDVAEVIETSIRHDALIRKATGAKPDLSLDDACARYWGEVARFQSNAKNTARAVRRLLSRLGKTTPLSGLGSGKIADYVAKRRGDRRGRRARGAKGVDTRPLVSNATVNRDLELLRRIMRRAARTWGAAVAEVGWTELLLQESAGRTRHLALEEERRLFQHLRPDFWPLVLFAALSGLRRSAIVRLTWRQVDLEGLEVRVVLKSKEPGGRPHIVPITPPMAAILQQERGRHSERVFTYVCERNRWDRYRKRQQRKGERYPFTANGWRKAWCAALEAAGVQDFRFHDLRHTAATRLLAASGNLKAVQGMLGHSEIATTARYAHVDVAELRRIMGLAHGAAAHPRHSPAADSSEDVEKPKGRDAG